jgi:hypothetical protein
LQPTYPVWPRNSAFSQLLIFKQTHINSELNGTENLLAFYTASKMPFFFGFLSILGTNVKFSSVPAYLFKTFLVLPHLSVQKTSNPYPIFE